MFTGRATRPVAVAVDNGKVSFLDARNLWGMTVGETWTYQQLRAHVRDITRGLHSSADDPDRAIFEELIRPDAFSRSIAPDGIPDIRVLVVQGKPVAAMLRVPTRQSGGRANLQARDGRVRRAGPARCQGDVDVRARVAARRCRCCR